MPAETQSVESLVIHQDEHRNDDKSIKSEHIAQLFSEAGLTSSPLNLEEIIDEYMESDGKQGVSDLEVYEATLESVLPDAIRESDKSQAPREKNITKEAYAKLNEAICFGHNKAFKNIEEIARSSGTIEIEKRDNRRHVIDKVQNFLQNLETTPPEEVDGETVEKLKTATSEYLEYSWYLALLNRNSIFKNAEVSRKKLERVGINIPESDFYQAAFIAAYRIAQVYEEDYIEPSDKTQQSTGTTEQEGSQEPILNPNRTYARFISGKIFRSRVMWEYFSGESVGVTEATNYLESRREAKQLLKHSKEHNNQKDIDLLTTLIYWKSTTDRVKFAKEDVDEDLAKDAVEEFGKYLNNKKHELDADVLSITWTRAHVYRGLKTFLTSLHTLEALVNAEGLDENNIEHLSEHEDSPFYRALMRDEILASDERLRGSQDPEEVMFEETDLKEETRKAWKKVKTSHLNSIETELKKAEENLERENNKDTAPQTEVTEEDKDKLKELEAEVKRVKRKLERDSVETVIFEAYFGLYDKKPHTQIELAEIVENNTELKRIIKRGDEPVSPDDIRKILNKYNRKLRQPPIATNLRDFRDFS